MQEEFLEHEFIRQNVLQKREYQLNLAENVLYNGNTLIVAPTALGKTIIAIIVAAEVLKKTKNTDKKLLFLAPTKPLALQHLQSLKKFLNFPKEKFVLLTGEIKPEERVRLWNSSKIVVATPQTIEADLLSKRISLENVCYAVFDEAHRAVGNFSYVFLANILQKQNKDALILGLTASPGAEETRITDVCRNLFINNLEVKTLYDEDVKPYVYGIDVYWIRVKLPLEFMRIKALLEGFIREKILEINKLGFSKIPKNYSMKMLLELQKEIINEIKIKGNKKNIAYFASSTLASMLKIVHAHTLLETQGISALKKYFDKLAKEKSKAAKTLLKNKKIKDAILLVEEFSSKNIEHPKREKLKELLLRELNKNPNQKIIVFNHYRDSIKPLEEYLNKFKPIKAKRFVGQANKINDKGLSQKKQAEIIKQFREGKFNVLLCSSVGEEGLDLPNVDLVIFYEPVPSCIRTIQRMGRTGRFKQGRVFILIAKDTRDEAFYWAAVSKQKKMNSLLKKLKNSEKKFIKQSTLKNFLNDENKTKIVIFADDRESNDIMKHLYREDVLLQIRKLKVGDFAIGDEIIIERKTTSDFLNSLIDGRLFNQLLEMRINYSQPLLIIEGKYEDLFSKRNIHKNAIFGALASIALTYKIPILFTSNIEETAEFIYLIAKREQQGKNKDIKLRFGKKGLTISEQQKFIVESFPNIGPTLAKALLRHFKNIRNIVNASIAELTKIPNLGRKKAEYLRKIFDSEYDEKEE